MHISLYCTEHPDLRWSAKEQAISRDGRYTGARRIFFDSPPPACECSCPASLLRAVPGQQWEGKAESTP